MKKAAVLLVLFSITAFAQQKGSFTDPRDGKTYKTVKIGVQTWMAENLNYAASSSKCYHDSSAYCKKYGRLYEWETAMRVCPSGWHLPSDDEWEILIDHIGGKENAGTKLKARNGWNVGGNGEDKYGFSALPGGSGFSDGLFVTVGYRGLWWSSSEYNSDLAYYRIVFYYYEGAYWGYDDKSRLFSVRCLQD